MPRAALYHRVSTVDQDPELAREELRRAAAARGCSVVLDVEETGSGATNDRPGLQRVLTAARRHQVDLVLVWKLDRFGRSVLDVLVNLRELELAGVKLIATSQGLESGGDAVGRLMLSVLAAVAEFERDLIRDRTRLGLARARRAGKRLGRPRVGPPPEPGAVANLRAMGASWSEVARELGCSTWTARQAVSGLAKRGCDSGGGGTVENGAPT